MRVQRAIPTLLVGALAGACSQYQPFDTEAHLAGQLRERVTASGSATTEVPFALPAELETVLEERYKPAPSERQRVEQVLDLIFRRINLKYELTPTRNAAQTAQSGLGNCLSFVNLFVGVARHQRLNPFYVEVTDYQRWNFKDGLVVSRGHIVAGIMVSNKLETYDFLPYRAKAYKDFKPIDDLTATAHFYNNLGAEALMDGRLEEALVHLRTAHQIAPDFIKAINNLGVALARGGDLDGALQTYLRGVEIAPTDVALLSNLARAYQMQGRLDEAAATLAKIEGENTSNPFFYVYQGEVALARGDLLAAIEYMREALRRDSEVPEVHLGLVKVYLEMGDLDRARHHLGRALRLDATNPEARRFAAMLQPRGEGAPEGTDGSEATAPPP